MRRLLLPFLLASLSACPRREPPPPRITLGPARTLSDFATRVTAGASRGSIFVVGTSRGRVLLRGSDGRQTSLGEPAAHEAAVVALALAADGTRLMSAGGRSIAAWDVPRRALQRRVAGPQTISAAQLSPDGMTAYFGTDQGHVLRWRLGQPSAEPLPQLACARAKLTPAQLRLPENRRCAFGTYVEPPQNGAVCAYPITALALRGSWLAAACREGTISFNDLASGRRSFYLAGYLRTVTPVGVERMLLGRGEGELRLYDVAGGKIVRELQPAGEPDAAAVDGELLVVAQGRRLHLWHLGHPAALAFLSLPVRAVWVSLRASASGAASARSPSLGEGSPGAASARSPSLGEGSPGEVRLLLENGRFVAHALSP